jgi:aryl-alcohol dehydrogenase-like predicted oxidoreductase
MEKRVLGRTGREVSVIGLGTWQLGGDWGEVGREAAGQVLDAAAESGVTFFDTADVYGDGRSEQAIGAWLAAHPDAGVMVGTKMGRRMPQVPENYSLEHFREWLDRSRRNLGRDTLDLVQLHCPPTSVYSEDRVFDALDQLVEEGVMRHYGVSVETTEEALAAIARPHVATVQIIFNPFRLKPQDEVFPAAQEAGVGIVVRVPLASGLLSGKYSRSTTFPEGDHRNYNRNGSAFDVGETFSGVDFEQGLDAVAEFQKLVPEGLNTAQAALAWITSQPGVSTVIPGARNAGQAQANAASAAGAASLGPEFDAGVRRIYNTYFREAIHPRW